jgi:hypothetical protein
MKELGCCHYCDTDNVVFENDLIKRCLRCMRDLPKQDDFSDVDIDIDNKDFDKE